MASSSSGVYGGLPFSYLSTNSPTDKQPPRSPRLSSRSSQRDKSTSDYPEESPTDPELKPFTYLTPNSPTDREQPEQQVHDGEEYDNQRRLPRDSYGNAYTDVNKIGSNPVYYTSMKDTGHARGEPPQDYPLNETDRHNAYIVPEYGNMPNTDYNHSEGYIPRPKVGYGVDPRDNYRGDPHGYMRASPNASGKPRPLSRDSYLDDTYKSKKGSNCRTVAIVLVLVLLALGAGFVAGWFVSKTVNSGDVSTDQEGQSASTDTTTLLSILSTSTTTEAMLPDSPSTLPTMSSITTSSTTHDGTTGTPIVPATSEPAIMSTEEVQNQVTSDATPQVTT